MSRTDRPRGQPHRLRSTARASRAPKKVACIDPNGYDAGRKIDLLAHSLKSEAQVRDRGRIVLLAASGTCSRAVACEIVCTPGTASRWCGRYATHRTADLSETGDRGAEPNSAGSMGGASPRCWIRSTRAFSSWTAPLLARDATSSGSRASSRHTFSACACRFTAMPILQVYRPAQLVVPVPFRFCVSDLLIRRWRGRPARTPPR